MINVRVVFSKTGSIRFISHLDVTRTMTRALRRTNLPIWYTEGFNKHPYITFAAPLSLGYEGLHETMDFRLVQDDFPLEQVCEQLNAVLPQGLYALSAAEAVQKAGAVAAARYRMYFSCSAQEIECLLQQQEIVVQKRTKSGGTRPMNIRPHIQQAVYCASDGSWEMTLPCSSETSVNPSLVIDALRQMKAQSDIRCHIIRLEVFDKDGNPFR